MHNEIVEKMREVHSTFATDSQEIQQHWLQYTERMDKHCEEAFRLNVKFSLNELNKAINGDGRNESSPLFKVSLNLDLDVLVFIPTQAELTHAVTSMGGKIIDMLSVIQRLPDELSRQPTKTRHRKKVCHFV